MPPLPKSFKLSSEVVAAQKGGQPIVALESTVVTHGLPQPQNLELAREMEAIVRAEGAVPATIAVLDGRVCIGLDSGELVQLANDANAAKASSRDLAALVVTKANGGTTVAGTLRAAAIAGIRVFATGGMGGVHRGSQWDVSADVYELAKQPLVLVSAGVKAILDIPATLELLETLAVPVIGYGTNDFPAFYSVSSGEPTSTRVATPEEIAELASIHWELGGGGILLANPLPSEAAIPRAKVEQWIAASQAEAENQGIRGQAVSPYLLKRVAELSAGRSLQANLALLKNNARLAAQVARALAPKKMRRA